MSQNDVERLLGRIITDADFRAKAASSLTSACFSEGFVLSSMELSLLSNLEFQQFGRIADRLDDSVRRGKG